MTTPETEIANLRAGLQELRGYFKTAIDTFSSPVDVALFKALDMVAAQTLKTPRASKITTVTIGEGLPPTSNP